MDFASELLVVLLAAVLIVFLIVAIVLVVYLIKLTKQIREITRSAERTVDAVGSAVSGIARFTSIPFLADQVTKAVWRVVKTSKSKSKKRGGDE